MGLDGTVYDTIRSNVLAHDPLSNLNKVYSILIQEEQVHTMTHGKEDRGEVMEWFKASDAFKLIHCDLWGPYKNVSSCGASYFLTIVDDYSRTMWIYLLIDKK